MATTSLRHESATILFLMSNPELEMFKALAADLSTRQSEAEASLLPRSGEQILGIGRRVLLLDFSVGVYVRGTTLVPAKDNHPDGQITMDFVVGNATVPNAKAIYMSYADRLTVNQNTGDTRGMLSVISLAKILQGLDLRRERPDGITPAFIVSPEEVEFVDGFARDPANSVATFHFTGEPGKPVSGIEVTHLD